MAEEAGSVRVWTEFTTDRQEVFLEALREIPNVTYAAEQAGVSRQTVYNHRETDPEFRAAWDAAIREGYDRVELEAHRRAVYGYEKPVFYQGREVGHYIEYSDALMGRLLQAYMPEKFSEKHKVEHSEGDPLTEALKAIDGTTLGPPSEREGAYLPPAEGEVLEHEPSQEEEKEEEEEEPPDDG